VKAPVKLPNVFISEYHVHGTNRVPAHMLLTHLPEVSLCPVALSLVAEHCVEGEATRLEDRPALFGATILSPSRCRPTSFRDQHNMRAHLAITRGGTIDQQPHQSARVREKVH
jgi:hypothetical protein